MATDRALLGSFLFVSPAASSRTRAPSLGGTSSTRSPADTSCQSSRWPVPPAPSTAQVRCGQAAAHASSRPAWATQARTRSSPQRLLRRADRQRCCQGGGSLVRCRLCWLPVAARYRDPKAVWEPPLDDFGDDTEAGEP